MGLKPVCGLEPADNKERLEAGRLAELGLLWGLALSAVSLKKREISFPLDIH